MDLKNSFEQLVKDQKSTIYTVCYMFSQDKEEIQDLFQETLINLWRGWKNFEERSQVRTWVWRITLNTCISADRKKRRRIQTERLTLDIDLYDTQQIENDVQLKQIRKLHERISKLGAFDRALVLLWLEDLSYEEIGNIVGISPENVAVKLHRIKESLKKMSNE